jgi:hypothetical protein
MTFRICAPLCLAPFFALPALAGDAASGARRIEIKAGAPAIVLSGVVQKGKDVAYVFKSEAGRKLEGRLTRKAGNIGFWVTDRSGDPLPEEEFDFNTHLKGSLTKSGDYRITVSTFEKRPSKFVLSVRVR